MTLTETLLSKPDTADQYLQATQNAFLRLGGQGRLPKDILSQWLSQDRLYAQAHCRFLGGLISQVVLPREQGVNSSLEWRIITMLKGALDGILRELDFFEQTAARYDLDLAHGSKNGTEFQANETTKGFIELFDSFGAQGKGRGSHAILQGLVVLWTTEKVYHDAWKFALEQGAEGARVDEDLDGGALRKEFIPNWTSEAFKGFVKEIGECLDAYAETYYNPPQAAAAAVEVWGEVLPLEEGFWPRIS